MSKPTTFTPPTPLELAQVRFEDELNLALDNISGAAHLLGTHADHCATDNEQCALNALSSLLFVEVSHMKTAHDRVKSLQVAESATTGGEQTEGSKTRDEDLSTRAIVDAAHIDCLTASSALASLRRMVVAGELDLGTETDMDAFSVFVDGINTYVEGVGAALDKLLDRLGTGDKKEG